MPRALPFRVRVKPWYPALLILWAASAAFILWTVASAYYSAISSESRLRDMWALLASVYDQPLATVELLGGDPLEVLMFFYIWLPVLAAPFGLLTRIDRE